MSNSVRPHRQQPTRLLCLWDSPRKNTGVGCHFVLQCMKVKSESEVAQCARLLATPWTTYLAPPSMGFSRQEYWSGVPWTLDNLMWGQEHSQLFPIHCFPVVCRKKTQELSSCCPLRRYISPAPSPAAPRGSFLPPGQSQEGLLPFQTGRSSGSGEETASAQGGWRLAQRLLGHRVR